MVRPLRHFDQAFRIQPGGLFLYPEDLVRGPLCEQDGCRRGYHAVGIEKIEGRGSVHLCERLPQHD